MKRSTPLKRGTSQLKRTPLKRVSKKLSKELKTYAKLRVEYLAAHQFCNVSIPHNPDGSPVEVCQGRASQIHHTKRRGQYLNDQSTWIAVCPGCHHWIETHANQSRELGLIKI